MKKIFCLIIALAPISVFAGYQQQANDKCDPRRPVENYGVVAKSVDGDTVHVQTASGTYSVRFLGIDTPETHFMGKSQGAWGDAAAARNQQLLPVGAQVQLEFGGESCDSHGRVLAFVYANKINVNAQLVKEGLAVNYCVAPTYKYCDAIGKLAGYARTHGIGMFSDPKVELPYDFRRRVQGFPQRSYVGDINTKEVYAPGNQEKVLMENRVFFYSPEAIQAPYHLVQ